MCVSSVLVALVSLRYFVLPGVGVPPPVAANSHFTPWMPVHATAASVALMLGPLQLVSGWRRQHLVRHRWLGRVYAYACVVSGASAIPLSAGVSTGWFAACGFGALAVLWLITTGLGVLQARGGDIVSHRRWMLRSFALTFAAVTLRIYLKLGLVLMGFEQFGLFYPIIAWLCWVPNILLIELYIRRTARGDEVKSS